MAHEYRHFTGTENPKEEQVRFEREIYNLLSDTYTAQTREDVKSSIRNLLVSTLVPDCTSISTIFSD